MYKYSYTTQAVFTNRLEPVQIIFLQRSTKPKQKSKHLFITVNDNKRLSLLIIVAYFSGSISI